MAAGPPSAWDVVNGRATLVDHGDVPPAGPMAPHLGRRIVGDELLRSVDSERFVDDPTGLDAMRVWLVPCSSGCGWRRRASTS
jgi:hypothetical protein